MQVGIFEGFVSKKIKMNIFNLLASFPRKGHYRSFLFSTGLSGFGRLMCECKQCVIVAQSFEPTRLVNNKF